MSDYTGRLRRLTDQIDDDLNRKPRPATVIQRTINGVTSIYSPFTPGNIWVAWQTPSGLMINRSVRPPMQQGLILKPGTPVLLKKDERGKLYIDGYDTDAMLARGQNPIPLSAPPKTDQTTIQTLAVIPTNPPSLSLSIKAWNPIKGNRVTMFKGVALDPLTVPSAGDMYLATIFVKADLRAAEVVYSTARGQTDVQLGEDDVNECLASKTPGSTPVWAQKLVGGQAAISQADLDADGWPLQQLVNSDDGVYVATASTTDATVTTLFTLTIPADTSVTITAKVTARRTGGSSGAAGDSAGYVRMATVADISGAATLVGSVDTPYTKESQAGWDCTIDVTGATARVRITGAVNNNISWSARVEVEQVS